jgi:hypothetical protein
MSTGTPFLVSNEFASVEVSVIGAPPDRLRLVDHRTGRSAVVGALELEALAGLPTEEWTYIVTVGMRFWSQVDRGRST